MAVILVFANFLGKFRVSTHIPFMGERMTQKQIRKRQGVFTLTEVQELAGVSAATFCYHRAYGAIPFPTVTIGKRRCYTPAQRDMIVEYFTSRQPRTRAWAGGAK
jgi:hypothetical protein